MNTHIDLSRYWYIFRGGIAAPFFSWFGIFLVVMVFYTFNASAQMMGDIVWQHAAFFATGWWTTIFGGAVSIGDASLTLMPLTLTGIVMYASYQSWRGRNIETWQDVVAATLSWPAILAGISLAGRAPGDWWFGLVGSAILAGICAIWSGRENLLYCLPWWSLVAQAWQYLRWLGLALLIIPSVMTLVFIIARFSAISEIHGFYLTGFMGSIGLILLQLLYLPVYVIWMFSWLIGAGFSVGSGTNFSIFAVSAGPLPAIPLFGALPAPGQNMIWLFVLVILLACGYGVLVARKFVSTTALRAQLIDVALAVGLGAVAVSVVSFMTSGAIGPGRMAVTGPEPALSAGLSIIVIGLPFMLGCLLSHPTSRTYITSHLPRKNSVVSESSADVESSDND
ncbi:cell division protein PerM [Arcanobacterium buesumense]|uniref:Uncharacterized protein n=1 Tax=Arcanobacterium buesumense TaxID=2722751 RepID=A0A6H2EMC7_9ACTO|nr:DUF6350 family protein [Arcanobacterium buesumense]QJC22221.1 hypothetical protein HC352_06660 [Arcanobacterium buesumense]